MKCYEPEKEIESFQRAIAQGHRLRADLARPGRHHDRPSDHAALYRDVSGTVLGVCVGAVSPIRDLSRRDVYPAGGQGPHDASVPWVGGLAQPVFLTKCRNDKQVTEERPGVAFLLGRDHLQFRVLCDRPRETSRCFHRRRRLRACSTPVSEALVNHDDGVHVGGKNPLSPRWAYKARTDRLMNELRIAAQEDRRVHEVALKDITELVRTARTENLTWEAIGAALGVSARTASRRHGHQ